MHMQLMRHKDGNITEKSTMRIWKPPVWANKVLEDDGGSFLMEKKRITASMHTPSSKTIRKKQSKHKPSSKTILKKQSNHKTTQHRTQHNTTQTTMDCTFEQNSNVHDLEGCIVDDEMLQTIVTAMRESRANSLQYPLLAKAMHIKTSDHFKGGDYQFEIRLDIDFDDWMKDTKKNQTEFINEISQIFDIEATKIRIDGYRRGSVILIMHFCAATICSAYQSIMSCVHGTANIKMEKNYIQDLRVQDQVHVLYTGTWYATTVHTWYDTTVQTVVEDRNIKHFKVRFNPLNDTNGQDPFLWNTEWFDCGKEADRLKFDGQNQWHSVQLAERDSVDQIEVNDQIFVKWDENDWRRCIVFNREQNCEAILLKIKDLMKGKTKTLNLSENADRDMIKFRDMRG